MVGNIIGSKFGGFGMHCINEQTNYVYFNEVSYVCSKNKKIGVGKVLMSVIDRACCYYGSSYQGRLKASKYFLKIRSKVPIIMREKDMIIFFPIASPRRIDNVWVNYSNVVSYKKEKEWVRVRFRDGEDVVFRVSFNVFNSQMLKCGRLIALYVFKDE